MKKYDIQEGDESLKRVLLMMNYDNKKTLSENREIIFEQTSFGEAAQIAKDLVNLLVGDVRTSHLNEIEIILKDRVLGKTLTDGTCLLNKVSEYLKNTKTNRWFTWGVFVPSDYKSRGLRDAILASKEKSEPQFEDVKKDLIKLIDNEINGFCKSPKKEEEKPQQTTTDSKYKQCNGPEFEFYCVNKVWIAKLQKCIGARPDGYFGEKTLKSLQGVRGFENFAQNDTITTEQIKSICDSKQQSNNNEKSPQDKVVIKKQTSGNTNNNQKTQSKPTSAATLDDVLGEPTKQA
jgi:hypothetical protein